MINDRPWMIVEATSAEVLNDLAGFGYSVVAGPGERVMAQWRRACQDGRHTWPINLLLGAKELPFR